MNEPLRILVLNERDLEHPRAGGAEIHVSRIFSRLARRGHTVTQYSVGFPGAATQTTIEDVLIEHGGRLPLYYLRGPSRIRSIIQESEIDIVVECLNKVPFYSPVYAQSPVLALCHHLFGEVAYDQVAFPIAAGVVLAERGLPRCYRDTPFLAISNSTRDDLIARGLPPEHIRVSEPGIDPPAGETAIDPDRERSMRATYVGRLEPYKRVDLLLRAGALLVDRFPSLELLVIGQGSARPALERLAQNLGIAERTRFTGFVQDAERDRLLADSRVCAFPSAKEGFGLTVIEANALGTPVVARDAPGLRDSIRDGETGRLVPNAAPEREPSLYAEALGELLDQSETTRRMQRESIVWSKHFDWERAADDMEAAIRDAIAGAQT